MAYRLDEIPRDSIGREPIGTVWFSHGANAWLRRTGPFRTQIIGTDEAIWRMHGRRWKRGYK